MKLASQQYLESVYAGVLGKVIGVYWGRPIEGRLKSWIIDNYGLVDRYIALENGSSLVLTDDDITGTFTFIRALEDTGLYADTPDEDFGKMWLNYIIENKSILWWGGMGVSAEHTAFLRLKAGIPSPRSGSAELNGKVVSEQIGAQIFIDGYGLVCPGNPQLAAKLAEKSARVSHDGEAVYGALVVAGMIAAAFHEKDMDKLLDIGASLIPAESIIARVHRDVRAWCRQDGNWHRTYDRIKEKYGYDKFGGCCHMVPNHALMVMAWCYAPNSMRDALAIVCTAGWDTDCNAANVGCLMGVKLGLSAIQSEYDYQGPMADRVMLPTAEPTRHVSDCLIEAIHIANIGTRVMKMPALPEFKDGARYHFSLSGSQHGFACELSKPSARPAALVSNVAHGKSRALAIDFDTISPNREVRVSTPITIEPTTGGYAMMGAPRIHSGHEITLRGAVESLQRGSIEVRLFARHYESATHKPTGMLYGPSAKCSADGELSLTLTIPELDGWPVSDLGVEITGDEGAAARVLVDAIAVGGKPHYRLTNQFPRSEKWAPLGAITDIEDVRGKFHEETEPFVNVVSNDIGHLVMGTTDWTDYHLRARVKRQLAERFGVIARYQGLQRFLLLSADGKKLRLVSRFYGDTVLAEMDCPWEIGRDRLVEMTLCGKDIVVSLDGREVLKGRDEKLLRGGFGFRPECGVMGFYELSVDAL